MVLSALCKQLEGGEFGIDVACEYLRGLARYVRICVEYMRILDL